MAKLITKFKYLKPDARQSVGGYAKYIATREGVEKIDESYQLAPSSVKQQQLIEKILEDFPDSKEMLEYEDYLKEPTVGNASEFITRALEDNAYEVMQTKTYADYIATRPRAQRFGSHGLFTDDGVQIKLNEVSDELNVYEGNVWTVIISLRREDAQRLGYNTGERWRDMLRTQTQVLAENFKIPMEHLKWYGAFHNESHHPHVHLMVYADEGIKPYLSKQGVMNLRSSLAKDIFAQDLYFVYEKQTEQRNALRQQSRELIAEIVSKINAGSYENPKLEEMLLQLADRLSKTGGKKQYGYLKADVKAMVNRIVDELASDERISSLYNLWYEQREEVIRTYTETMPERVPLSQNKEFKSIRNAVVQEAMNIAAEHDPIVLPDEDAFTVEEPDMDEPEKDEASKLSEKEKTSVMWKLYRKAKELLDKDSAEYNPSQAVKLLMESAGLGCGIAKYRLGKMFLRGEDVPKNVDYALLWLEKSADEDNPYAEYLLGKTLLKGEDTKQDLIRAESLLRRSSEQHNKYASYTLGKALLDGNMLIQDIPEVVRLLTESADSGFLPAEYLLGKLLYHGEVVERDIGKALLYLERAAEKENACAACLAGKIRLTEDGYMDIQKAIRLFQIAAAQENHYAEYQLGLIYLKGKDIQRDEQQAIRWLTASSEHGNQYAAQLLHSIKNNRNWFAAMSTLRLLHHMSQMIRNRLEDERKGKSGAIIDRKLRRKIQEKNEALGIKQG